jgi:hypothetical protein
MKDFRNLLEYYIACIENEEINSLTFDIKKDYKKFISNVFREEQFFFRSVEQVSTNEKIVRDFIAKLTTKNHLF